MNDPTEKVMIGCSDISHHLVCLMTPPVTGGSWLSILRGKPKNGQTERSEPDAASILPNMAGIVTSYSSFMLFPELKMTPKLFKITYPEHQQLKFRRSIWPSFMKRRM